MVEIISNVSLVKLQRGEKIITRSKAQYEANVKHFISTTNSGMGPNYSNQEFVGGYCNTTSAVTGVRFLFDSGNIDAGTFKLYGVT